MLKNMYRTVALKSLIFLVRTINFFIPKKGIVICSPPAPEHSKGDQGILLSTLDYLSENTNQELFLLQTSKYPIKTIKEDERLSIRNEFYHLFTSPRSFPEKLRFIRFLLRKKHIVLIGCDVLDGKYSFNRSIASLNAIYIASRTGIPSRIVSFSFNDVPSPSLKKVLSGFSKRIRLYPRDPISYDRLSTNRNLNLNIAGDLAYLLKPSRYGSLNSGIKEFINKNKGKIIGLNFTELAFGKYDDKFFKNIAKACHEISKEHGFRFLLIPHHHGTDTEYMRRIYNKMKKVAYFLDPIPSARELKRILNECEHIFSSRLHLSIFALGMDTPVTCFPYQGKFEGQLKDIGIEESLLPVEELPEGGKELKNLLLQSIQKGVRLKKKIKENKPFVIKSAKKNFEGVK